MHLYRDLRVRNSVTVPFPAERLATLPKEAIVRGFPVTTTINTLAMSSSVAMLPLPGIHVLHQL